MQLRLPLFFTREILTMGWDSLNEIKSEIRSILKRDWSNQKSGS